jgi:hypothetical protein
MDNCFAWNLGRIASYRIVPPLSGNFEEFLKIGSIGFSPRVADHRSDLAKIPVLTSLTYIRATGNKDQPIHRDRRRTQNSFLGGRGWGG